MCVEGERTRADLPGKQSLESFTVPGLGPCIFLLSSLRRSLGSSLTQASLGVL